MKVAQISPAAPSGIHSCGRDSLPFLHAGNVFDLDVGSKSACHIKSDKERIGTFFENWRWWPLSSTTVAAF